MEGTPCARYANAAKTQRKTERVIGRRSQGTIIREIGFGIFQIPLPENTATNTAFDLSRRKRIFIPKRLVLSNQIRPFLLVDFAARGAEGSSDRHLNRVDTFSTDGNRAFRKTSARFRIFAIRESAESWKKTAVWKIQAREEIRNELDDFPAKFGFVTSRQFLISRFCFQINIYP